MCGMRHAGIPHVAAVLPAAMRPLRMFGHGAGTDGDGQLRCIALLACC